MTKNQIFKSALRQKSYSLNKICDQKKKFQINFATKKRYSYQIYDKKQIFKSISQQKADIQVKFVTKNKFPDQLLENKQVF